MQVSAFIGAFECNTSFNVLGKLDWNVAENMLPTGVGLESVRLDSVAVSGEFGPVNINGVLNFYYDDPTFGNGMRGEVSAIFEPAISLQAVAQFGQWPSLAVLTIIHIGMLMPWRTFLPIYSL